VKHMAEPLHQELDREFHFTDADFDYLAKLVKREMGIVLAEHKKAMVYSRIARRLRAVKMKRFEDYCRMLDENPDHPEMRECLNALTTNLTGFFRESHHFDHLKQVLTEMAQNPENSAKRIRIWSSACSSGPEPYSIAMIVHEVFGSLSGWDVRILATDIDSHMVDTAAKGEYPEHLVEKVPENLRKKYIIRAGGPGSDKVKVVDHIRNYITFKTLNLLTEWPFKGPFDVVFCRNVVIYFDRPTQVTLFDKIADKMAPNGWLYIGHSESLFKVSDRFELEGKTVYQRIK
jgi:chemotaxis protein methyltransferase CheR